MSDSAPWLKAMENGGLGEARARAFLMERFWVLERSVDIDGADYLIQQRLTATNFLDAAPPRLGVVQVKFIQDGSTYIKVHRSYVTDQNGSPYNEFFLLVFAGKEDEQRSFLLSSADMLKEFNEIKDEGKVLLRLRGAQLINGSNYEIKMRKPALDRIEHALKNADFLANRRFIGATRYVQLSPDQIDHDLTMPLHNGWGDIRKEFFKGKKKLQSTLYEMEEVAEAFGKIIQATDPLEALRVYEEEVSDHVGRGAFRDEISFRCEFFDEDFFVIVKNHRARLAKLKDLGIGGAYFDLIQNYEAASLKQVLDVLESDPTLKAVQVSVSYDKKTLAAPTIGVFPASAPKGEPEVTESEEGRQIFVVALPDGIHDVTSADREGFLRERMWRFRKVFLTELDRTYLGEHLVDW